MRISDWSSDVCSSDLRFRASLRSESGVAWRPSGRNKGGGIRRQADAGGHSPRRPAGRVGPARSRRTTRSGNAQSSAPRRSAALPADFGATRSDVEAEVQHVAFLDPVFLAFQAQAAGVAGPGLALGIGSGSVRGGVVRYGEIPVVDVALTKKNRIDMNTNG